MKKIFTILSFSFLICMFSYNSMAQTIPNSGFENWTNVNAANGWKSNNTTMVFFLRQSTSSHSGTYAAEISSKANGSAGNLSGILTLGTINAATQTVSGGFPISSKPTDLHGFYKYTAGNGADQMTINVVMTKWSGTTRLTLANATFTSVAGQTVSAYTQFTIPLTYNPTTITPDTFNIIIKSSKTTAVVGTIAWVDDLAFTTATGIEETSTFKPSMWPNPAKENVNFNLDGEQYNISISNIIGQTVATTKTNDKLFNLNTMDLPNGIYNVNLESKTNSYSLKLIISK